MIYNLVFLLKVFLMHLYYLINRSPDEQSVDEYRVALRAVLPNVVGLPFETFEQVKRIVDWFKLAGIFTMQEQVKFYKDFEDSNNREEPLKMSEGFFLLFQIKTKIPNLNIDGIKNEDILDVLKFFRLVGKYVEKLTPSIKERVFTTHEKFFEKMEETDKKESTLPSVSIETLDKVNKKRKSLIDTFLGLYKGNITFKHLGNFVKTLKTGEKNYFAKLRLTMIQKNGNVDFDIYVPMMVGGIYRIGRRVFMPTNLYDDFIKGQPTTTLSRIIKYMFGSYKTLMRSYSFSKENIGYLQKGIQDMFLNTFFVKRIVYATDAEKKLHIEQYGDAFQFEDNPYWFMPFTDITDMTPYERRMEARKFYMKQHTKINKTSGAFLLKRFGDKGFNGYQTFPLNKKFLKWFDPSYLNSKGDYLIAWGDNIPEFVKLDCFSLYNKKAVRNSKSPFGLGHAFALSGVEPNKPLVISIHTQILPPSYNMPFAFMPFVDSSGVSTDEGQRILTKHTKLPVYTGIKIAFVGSDKGVCAIGEDEVYTFVDGKKLHLNIVDMLPIVKRQNASVLISGLVAMKRYVKGLGVLERDPEIEVAAEDMMDNMDIYVNGKKIGTAPIGMMSSYFVREMDSSFRKQEHDEEEENEDEEEKEDTNSSSPRFHSYNLSVEWNQTARLMGAKKISQAVLGDIDKRYTKVVDDPILFKKHGKKGAVVKRVFQNAVLGFSSTAIANTLLPFGTTRINLTDEESFEFFSMIHHIENRFEVERAIKDFKSNKLVPLPPGLQIRNPFMDTANTITMSFEVKRLVPSRFIKYGYIEVCPVVWARQGGDFDGDQVMIVFFKYNIGKDLAKFYSYQNYMPNKFKEDSVYMRPFESLFNTRIAENAGVNIYENRVGIKKACEEFVGRNKTLDDTLKNTFELVEKNSYNKKEFFSMKSLEEQINASSKNPVATMVGKSLIGIAKSITMRTLSFVEAAIEHYDLGQEVKDKLLKTVFKTNYELGQKVIDIEKHVEDLRNIVETGLICYRMIDAVSLLIEGEFGLTYKTHQKLLGVLLKAGFLQLKKYITASGIEKEVHVWTGIEFHEALAEIKPYYYRQLLKEFDIFKHFKEITFLEDEKEVKYNMFVFNTSDYEFDMNDPEQTINKMIDVIDIEGKIYNMITSGIDYEIEKLQAKYGNWDVLDYLFEKGGEGSGSPSS